MKGATRGEVVSRPDTYKRTRKTGLDMMGNVPSGTHICHFYQTKEDLLDILVPYFKAGLEGNELCIPANDILLSY